MILDARDEQSVREVVNEYLQAWDRDRDPKACADIYERDGDLLAADGEFLASPEEIERYYVDRLGGAYADFRVRHFEIFSLRGIRPDIAILDARWEIVQTDASGAELKGVARLIGTFLLAKADDRWRISAARVMVPWKPG